MPELLDLNALLPELFSTQIAGNLLIDYVIAVVAFFITIIVIKIIKWFTVEKIKGFTENTETEFDNLLIEIVQHIGWPLYLVAGLFVGSFFVELPLPSTVKTGLHFLVIVTATYYGIKAAQSIGHFWLRKTISERAGKAITSFFDTMLKIVLWSLALLLILSNMGYNINSLIAGLGIGGIAIAFALQKVLEDIFSAFSIYYDKPFEVGDFIIIGDDLGTVKDIGLKSTRIQTLKGQELVVSNREMTNTRINNYKKMKKRRITFEFGVTYQTPLKKLKEIPKTVKKIVKETKNAELDRVHFKSYGDFALIYQVVYYMLVPDYNKYMDTQQEINLALKEEFERAGIEFAYPTQTIYHQKIK